MVTIYRWFLALYFAISRLILTAYFCHVLFKSVLNWNENLNRCMFLTDFETSAMAAVMSTWPTTELRGCRFHLGQSWWRIQQIILACSYNDKNSDIAKWLLKFFRLSSLPANEIEDVFAEDIMDDAPSDAKCVEFADYVYNNYISSDCQFPPKSKRMGLFP